MDMEGKSMSMFALDTGGHKICFRCKQDKPLSEFHKDSSKKDGLRGKCRQCCFEANKEYYSSAHGKAIVSGQTKRKWIRTKKKVSCRNLLNIAIMDGIVFKKPCQICGSPHVEAHHDDYDKPLEVVWLCRFHHNELHGKRINNVN